MRLLYVKKCDNIKDNIKKMLFLNVDSQSLIEKIYLYTRNNEKKIIVFIIKLNSYLNDWIENVIIVFFLNRFFAYQPEGRYDIKSFSMPSIITGYFLFKTWQVSFCAAGGILS